MDFIDVCAWEDVPRGGSRPARVRERDIALFKVGDRMHVIENSCPHRGGALTGGRLNGRILSCPSHGLRIDVGTGEMLAAPNTRVECFPVRISGNRVLVGFNT